MIILWETIKMVGKVFRANKLRTILTMLGIIVGIFSVTMIFAVSDGTKDKISKEFKSMDQTTITINVSPNNYDNKGNDLGKTIFPYDSLVKLIKESKVITNGTISSPRIWAEANEALNQERLESEGSIQEIQSNMSSSSDESKNTVNAVSYDFFNVREKLNSKVVAGRLFTKFDEDNQAFFALVNEEVAQKKFGSAQKAIGSEISINHIAYKIIGVLQRNKSESSGPWDSQFVYPAYVLHCAASDVSSDQQGGQPTEYILKVRSTADRAQAQSEVKQMLKNYLTDNQYGINMGFGNNQEATNNIMDLITMVFAGIAGLSLIVGGIGIMNIMLVSVNERIKEIGIRQALGARRWHILMQFLVEAIALTIIAGMIGMVIAQAVVMWLNTQHLGIVLVVNIKIMISVTLFCSVVGIIFGYYPANKASKLNIADALRYE